MFVVGEPLSTGSWKWYYNMVGKKQCILVDTWWQTGNTLFLHIIIAHLETYCYVLTETGGIAISPQPGPPDGKLKPGCPMRPFFGVEPVLTNEKVTFQPSLSENCSHVIGRPQP